MFYPEKQEETELPPMTEHGRKIRIYDSAGNEGFIDPKPPKTTKMIHIDIVRKKPGKWVFLYNIFYTSLA